RDETDQQDKEAGDQARAARVVEGAPGQAETPRLDSPRAGRASFASVDGVEDGGRDVLDVLLPVLAGAGLVHRQPPNGPRAEGHAMAAILRRSGTAGQVRA